MTEFKDFLKPEIASAIGYSRPTAVQRGALRHILEGSDVLNQAMSGSGRTLSSIICALEMIDLSLPEVSVIVLCSDVKKVYEKYRHVSRHIDKIGILGLGMGPMSVEKEKFRISPPNIVIGYPLRILNYVADGMFSLDSVQQIIIHSADKLFPDRHRKKDIFNLFELPNSAAQVIIDSKTINDDMREDIESIMNPGTLKVITDADHREEAKRGGANFMPIKRTRAVNTVTTEQRDVSLRIELLRSLEFEDLTDIQYDVISAINDKHDVICWGKPRSGKTTGIVLGMLNSLIPERYKTHVLVLTSISSKNYNTYSNYATNVDFAKVAHFGLKPFRHDDKIYKTGSWPVVLSTVERCAALCIGKTMVLKDIRQLIIHECDVLFDKTWSPKTPSLVSRIVKYIGDMSKVQVIMECGKETLKPEVIAECKKYLKTDNLFSNVKGFQGNVNSKSSASEAKPGTSSQSSSSTEKLKSTAEQRKQNSKDKAGSKLATEVSKVSKNVAGKLGLKLEKSEPAKTEPAKAAQEVADKSDKTDAKSASTEPESKTSAEIAQHKPSVLDSPSKTPQKGEEVEELGTKKDVPATATQATEPTKNTKAENVLGSMSTKEAEPPEPTFSMWLKTDLNRAVPYTKPRKVQKYIIPEILQKESIIHQSEKGSGKTTAVILGSLQICDTKPSLSIIALCSDGVNNLASMYQRYSRFLGYRVLTLHPMSFEEYSKIKVDEYKIIVGHPNHVADLMKAQIHKPLDVITINMHSCFSLVTEGKSDLAQAVGYIARNIPTRQVLIEAPTISVFLLRIYKEHFPSHKLNVSSIDSSIMDYAKRMDETDDAASSGNQCGAQKGPAPVQGGESPVDITEQFSPKRPRQDMENKSVQEKDGHEKEKQEEEEVGEEMEQNKEGDGGNGENASSSVLESEQTAAQMEIEEKMEEETWGVQWKDQLAEAVAELNRPTQVQYDVISAINDKHDVICWGKPRSGKTTGIVLGMLNNLTPEFRKTHVLALTSESESSKNFGTYFRYNPKVLHAKVAHFGLRPFKEDDKLYRIRSWPVVLSTVERCAALYLSKTVSLKDIRQLIIHECDVLLDETRSPKTPSLVSRIVEYIGDMSKVQVIMECGKETLKPEVLTECKKYLKMNNLFSNVKGLKGTVNPSKSSDSEARPDQFDAEVIIISKTISDDMREDIKSITNPERLKAVNTVTTVQTDASLRIELLRSLEFEVLTDLQDDVISAINDQHDVICWGKPCSGKTTGIVLGMLNNITPERYKTHVLALTSESSKNFNTYLHYGPKVQFAKVAHFGLKPFKEDDKLYRFRSWPVVLSTVERCAALCIAKTMVLKDIRQLIIHECDVLLDKTRSPKTPSLLGRIVEDIPDMSKVQVIMECGEETLKPEVLAECKKYLKMNNLFSNVKGLKGTVNPPQSSDSKATPGTSSQSTSTEKSTTEQGKQKIKDNAGSKLVTEASEAKSAEQLSKSSSATPVSINVPDKPAEKVPDKAAEKVADKSADNSDKTDVKAATTMPESKTSTETAQYKPSVPDNTSKTPQKEEVIVELGPKRDVPSAATQTTKPDVNAKSKNVSDSVPKPKEPEPPEPTFSAWLKKDLIRAVPFSKPSKIQKYIIPEILQKESIIHQSEMGSGKTTAVILGSLQICDTKPSLSIIALCSDGVNNLASLYQRYSRFLGYRVLTVHPMPFEEYSKIKVDEYKIIVGHPTHVADLMKAQIHKPLDVITINMHRCFSLVTEGKSDVVQAVGYIAKNIPTRQVLIEASTISVFLLRIYKEHFPLHTLKVSSIDRSIMEYAKRMDERDDASSSGVQCGAQKRPAPEQGEESPVDKTEQVSPKRPRQDMENKSTQEKDGQEKEKQGKEEEAVEMEQNEEGDGGNGGENDGSNIEEYEEPAAQMETEEKMEEEMEGLWALGVPWRDCLAEVVDELIHPSQVQYDVISAINDEHDVICWGKPRSGKTRGIVLGMLNSLIPEPYKTHVLALTSESESSKNFTAYYNYAPKVKFAKVAQFGLMSFKHDDKIYKERSWPVVLSTVERCAALCISNTISLEHIRQLIIHECDVLLDKTRSPETPSLVSRIVEYIGDMSKVQVIMECGKETLKPEVLTECKKYLKMNNLFSNVKGLKGTVNPSKSSDSEAKPGTSSQSSSTKKLESPPEQGKQKSKDKAGSKLVTEASKAKATEQQSKSSSAAPISKNVAGKPALKEKTEPAKAVPAKAAEKVADKSDKTDAKSATTKPESKTSTGTAQNKPTVPDNPSKTPKKEEVVEELGTKKDVPSSTTQATKPAEKIESKNESVSKLKEQESPEPTSMWLKKDLNRAVPYSKPREDQKQDIFNRFELPNSDAQVIIDSKTINDDMREDIKSIRNPEHLKIITDADNKEEAKRGGANFMPIEMTEAVNTVTTVPKDVSLRIELLRSLEFEELTDIQYDVIAAINDQHDVICCGKPSSGKTTGIVLGMLNNLTPERYKTHVLALTSESSKNYNTYSNYATNVDFAKVAHFGPKPFRHDDKIYRTGSWPVVLSTVERCAALCIGKTIDLKDIRQLIIHECDVLLDKTLSPKTPSLVGRIVECIHDMSNVQVIMECGIETLKPEVLAECKKYLTMNNLFSNVKGLRETVSPSKSSKSEAKPGTSRQSSSTKKLEQPPEQGKQKSKDKAGCKLVAEASKVKAADQQSKSSSNAIVSKNVAITEPAKAADKSDKTDSKSATTKPETKTSTETAQHKPSVPDNPSKTRWKEEVVEELDTKKDVPSSATQAPKPVKNTGSKNVSGSVSRPKEPERLEPTYSRWLKKDLIRAVPRKVHKYTIQENLQNKSIVHQSQMGSGAQKRCAAPGQHREYSDDETEEVRPKRSRGNDVPWRDHLPEAVAKFKSPSQARLPAVNMTEFKDFLKPEIASSIGYSRPTAVQRGALRHILEGSDVFNQAMSGSGRTLSSIICALEMIDLSLPDVSVIVLCSDVKKVYEKYRHVSRHIDKIRIFALGVGPTSVEKEKFRFSPPNIVIGYPLRILNSVREGMFSLDYVEQIIIHSADKLFQDRHRKQDIFNLFELPNSDAQVIIDSKTINNDMIEDIKSLMNPESLKILTDADHREEGKRGGANFMPIKRIRAVKTVTTVQRDVKTGTSIQRDVNLRVELQRSLEFEDLTDIQYDVISAINDQHDVICWGKPSSGKTTGIVLGMLNNLTPAKYKTHVLALTSESSKNYSTYSNYATLVKFAKVAHFGHKPFKTEHNIYMSGSWPVVLSTVERCAEFCIGKTMVLKDIHKLIIHECDVLFDKTRSPKTPTLMGCIVDYIGDMSKVQVIIECGKETLKPEVLAECKKYLKTNNLFSNIKGLKGTVNPSKSSDSEAKPGTSSQSSSTEKLKSTTEQGKQTEPEPHDPTFSTWLKKDLNRAVPYSQPTKVQQYKIPAILQNKSIVHQPEMGFGAQKRAAPERGGDYSDDETEEVCPKRPRQDNKNKSAQEKDGKENQGEEEEAEDMEQSEKGDLGNMEEIVDLWDLGIPWRDYLAEAVTKFKRPSQVQCELVPLIVEGYDVLCQAPRGQFTTTGIVLGMVQQLTCYSPKATVLFLSTGIDELREVSETFSGFADFATNVAVSVVGMNTFEFERQKLQGNGVNPVVLGTPGIILKLAKAGILSLKETKHFIIHHCDTFLRSPELCQQLHSIFTMTHPKRQVVLEASTCLSHIRPLCRTFMRGGILTSQWVVLDKGKKARITVSEPLEDVMACLQEEGQEH